MSTVVHLVRHGEVYNPDKVLYGRLPGYHLSERGFAQAHQTAAFLAGRDIVHLVSSPLLRARQTAKPIAESLGLDLHQDVRLIEAANQFEGQQVAGGGHNIAKPSNWKLLVNPIRPSWGEPYAEIAVRMLAAVHAARDAAEGHEAVCVSHQLPIVTIRRYVQGQRLWHDPRKRECATASVTSLTFDGDDVVSVGYAEPAGATPKGSVAGA